MQLGSIIESPQTINLPGYMGIKLVELELLQETLNTLNIVMDKANTSGGIDALIIHRLWDQDIDSAIVHFYGDLSPNIITIDKEERTFNPIRDTLYFSLNESFVPTFGRDRGNSSNIDNDSNYKKGRKKFENKYINPKLPYWHTPNMQNDNMDETIKIVMISLFSDFEKDITNNIKEGNDSQTYYIESQAIDTLDEGLYKLSMYKGSGDKSSIKIFKIIQSK